MPGSAQIHLQLTSHRWTRCSTVSSRKADILKRRLHPKSAQERRRANCNNLLQIQPRHKVSVIRVEYRLMGVLWSHKEDGPLAVVPVVHFTCQSISSPNLRHTSVASSHIVKACCPTVAARYGGCGTGVRVRYGGCGSTCAEG
uniref:Uncharacterized protein n=1 Tax=Branchiostoma floridae TaxID=7739 RepID=C3YYC4_BRAFL|eukprot:XP_002598731.1 hypothetical protein BRAFLDRAFT_95847 [Branchiostoma floridae]